jgi:hypothetical protein
LGVAIGEALGTPLGVAAAAVDETFQTAGDVVDANPRYRQRAAAQAPRSSPSGHTRSPVTAERRSAERSAQSSHYYRAEVLVKIRGPAKIETIDFVDSEEVVGFWK